MIVERDSKSVALFRLAKGYAAYLEAKNHLDSGAYNESINRSYYSMFYCANAVLILNGMVYKRHKDVMGNFNKTFVGGGIFDRKLGHAMHIAESSRNDCDYDDFVIATRSDAEENVTNALTFFEAVSPYVFTRTREMSRVDLVVYARVMPDYVDEFYDSVPVSMLTEENIMMLIKNFNDSKLHPKDEGGL